MGRGNSKGGGGNIGGNGSSGVSANTPKMPANGQYMNIMQMAGQYPKEVQDVMNVLADVEDKYGARVRDTKVVASNSNWFGAYSANNELKINANYFNGQTMDKAYDSCVRIKFHPPRGSKSGMEAVVAHEMGHRLTHIAANRNWFALDGCADHIVMDAAKSMKMGNKVRQFRGKISGYAKKNSAECVAEAFADVYCNGSNACAESRAVVNFLNARLTNIGVTVKP